MSDETRSEEAGLHDVLLQQVEGWRRLTELHQRARDEVNPFGVEGVHGTELMDGGECRITIAFENLTRGPQPQVNRRRQRPLLVRAV